MKTPNRNYLAAQNKVLIEAGNRLAFLIRGSEDIYPRHGADMQEAFLAWDQAKKNLMGLAGRRA